MSRQIIVHIEKIRKTSIVLDVPDDVTDEEATGNITFNLTYGMGPALTKDSNWSEASYRVRSTKIIEQAPTK